LSIVRSLTQMGFAPSFTCAPYLLRSPSVGEHLAWGESSAVALANTYYGAMTNREGGPLALLCAIAGRTYEAGLHLSENRVPTIELIVPREISRELSDPGVAGALGYVVGEKLSGHVPLLRGASRMTFESLRAYTAAAGATGDIALTIVEGVTPGWQRALASAGRLERVEIEAEEVRGLLRDLDDSIDTIFIGCPHATLEEIRSVFETLSRRGRAEQPRIVVSTSRQVYELAESMGFISRADELGVEIVKDTCPVVSPMAPRLGAVATTSAKCLFYLPRLHGTKAKLIAWSSLGALNVVAQKR
ncbi:MAG: aconitase X, partial [Fervidicoccaceae archaeon]